MVCARKEVNTQRAALEQSRRRPPPQLQLSLSPFLLFPHSFKQADMLTSLVAPRAILRCCKAQLQLQPVALHVRSFSTRRHDESGSSILPRKLTVLPQRKGQSELRRLLHATRVSAQDLKEEVERKAQEIKNAAVESAAAKATGALTDQDKTVSRIYAIMTSIQS